MENKSLEIHWYDEKGKLTGTTYRPPLRAEPKTAGLADCPNCYIDHELDSYYTEPGGFQAFSTHMVLRPCHKHRFPFSSADRPASLLPVFDF